MNKLFSLPALAFEELTLFERASGEARLASSREFTLSKAFYPFVGLVVGVFVFFIHEAISFVLPETIADLFVVVGIAFFSNGKHLSGMVLVLNQFIPKKLNKPFWKNIEQLFKMPPLIGIVVVAVLWLWLFGLLSAPFEVKRQIILVLPVASHWGIFLFSVLGFFEPLNANDESKTNEGGSLREKSSSLTFAFAFTFASFGILLNLNGLIILLIMSVSLVLIAKMISNKSPLSRKAVLGAVHEFSGIIFLLLSYCIL